MHRVSRQAVQGQVVAALVIRDAVGDAISRQQAAVKPGPWPGRRAAGEALSRASSVLGGHVHERRALRLPALTWAPFTSTSGGLRQVYLYLRPPTPALPDPPPPPSGPSDRRRMMSRACVVCARPTTSKAPAHTQNKGGHKERKVTTDEQAASTTTAHSKVSSKAP